MSVQTIFGSGNFTASGTFQFLVGRHSSLTGANIPLLMPAPGDFANWHIELDTAPGAGKTKTWTIEKNSSATALTITISDAATSGSDTTNTVSFSAGDTIRVVCTSTGAVGASDYRSSIDFTPTTAETQIFGTSGNVNAANPDLAPLSAVNATTSAGFNGRNIFPTAGTVTAMYATTVTAPGSGGDSFIYALTKNGVTQDGSGGTTDTRVTILNAAKTASATFSLAVAAGDLIGITFSTGGPSPGGSAEDGVTLAFVPTTAGEGFTGGLGITAPTGTASYHWPYDSLNVYNGTESARQFIGATADTTITGIYVETSAAPGTSKSWAFMLRKNGSDTSITVTVSGAATTASATGLAAVGIALGDVWTLKVTPSGTPAGTAHRVSFVLDANASPTATGNFFALLVSP